jgi:hypothetical protein
MLFTSKITPGISAKNISWSTFGEAVYFLAQNQNKQPNKQNIHTRVLQASSTLSHHCPIETYVSGY